MILIAERFNTAKYGTVLSLWFVGGEHTVVRRPFDPYFYSLVKGGFNSPLGVTTTCIIVFLAILMRVLKGCGLTETSSV